jgi:hypothetical protein
LAIVGCDRPFVDPTPPEIEIVAPDIAQIFEDSVTVLKVRATSFRGIARIERDGRPLPFDEVDDAWVDTLSLRLGFNEFRVSAFDEAGVEGVADLSLLRMRFTFSNDAPTLPAPFRLGEHTATLLGDGRLLLAGGTPGMVDPALGTAFVLEPGAAAFELLPNRMIRPRTGHAAARLPDGRVLFVGGSSRGTPVQLSHFVDEVELFDPRTNRFHAVPYRGPAIDRAYHVMFASTDDRGIIVDIQGGLGENTVDQSSEIAPLRDFRSFRLVGDSLIAIGSGGIAIEDIGRTYNHTAVPLDAGSFNTRYFVAGSFFAPNTARQENFVIDFASAPLDIHKASPFVRERFRHASAAFQPGIFFTFGGRASLGGGVLQNTEVYVESLDRFFLFENPPSTQRRHGHTATKLPNGRILLIGGFIGNGDALSSTEYFDPGFGL